MTRLHRTSRPSFHPRSIVTAAAVLALGVLLAAGVGVAGAAQSWQPQATLDATHAYGGLTIQPDPIGRQVLSVIGQPGKFWARSFGVAATLQGNLYSYGDIAFGANGDEEWINNGSPTLAVHKLTVSGNETDDAAPTTADFQNHGRSLSVRADGAAVVAWGNDLGIFTAWRPAGGTFDWAGRQQVYAFPPGAVTDMSVVNTIDLVKVALQPSGAAALLYRIYQSGNTAVPSFSQVRATYASSLGSHFTGDTEIPTGADVTTNVATAPSGKMVATFADSTGAASGCTHVAAVVYLPGSTFTAPAVLATTSSPLPREAPVVAIDPSDGHAAVAWPDVPGLCGVTTAAIRIAELPAGATTFAAPREVASQAGSVMSSGLEVGTLAIGANAGRTAVAWPQCLTPATCSLANPTGSTWSEDVATFAPGAPIVPSVVSAAPSDLSLYHAVSLDAHRNALASWSQKSGGVTSRVYAAFEDPADPTGGTGGAGGTGGTGGGGSGGTGATPISAPAPTPTPATPITTPVAPTVVLNAARVSQALAALLAPSGKPATLKSIAKAGGYTATVKAPAPGTFTLAWYQVVPGSSIGSIAKVKAKPVLVATGTTTFAAAGAHPLMLKLTAAGKRLAKGTKSLHLTAVAHATPTGSTRAVRVTKAFTLKP